MDEEEKKFPLDELKELGKEFGIEFKDNEWKSIANADPFEDLRRDQLALEEEFAQRRREQQQREGWGCLNRCLSHVVWWAFVFFAVRWAYRTWF